MQVDAVHVSGGQERQGGSGNAQLDTGNGKSKTKNCGKGKEKDDKPAGRFEGECRYCQKKGQKKTECRKMKADLEAGRCDKSGKPTGVNSLTAAGATKLSSQPSYAPSAVCSNVDYHPDAADRPCAHSESRWQSVV